MVFFAPVLLIYFYYIVNNLDTFFQKEEGQMGLVLDIFEWTNYFKLLACLLMLLSGWTFVAFQRLTEQDFLIRR